MNLNDLDLEPVTTPEQTRAPGSKPATRDAFFDDPAPPAPPAPVTAPAAMRRRAARTEYGVVAESPVLKKMRSILGLTEDTITRVPVYIGEDQEPVFTFGLRPLGADDFEWCAAKIMEAAELAGEVLLENPTPKQKMRWDHYILACSIASIDEGAVLPEEKPTPVWQALGIPIPTSAHVRNPYSPHAIVRQHCAEILYDELRQEFYAFTQLLLTAYRTTVESSVRMSSSPYTPDADEPAENPTTPER